MILDDCNSRFYFWVCLCWMNVLLLDFCIFCGLLALWSLVEQQIYDKVRGRSFCILYGLCFKRDFLPGWSQIQGYKEKRGLQLVFCWRFTDRKEEFCGMASFLEFWWLWLLMGCLNIYWSFNSIINSYCHCFNHWMNCISLHLLVRLISINCPQTITILCLCENGLVSMAYFI